MTDSFGSTSRPDGMHRNESTGDDVLVDILNAIPDGTFATDRDGRVVCFNDAAGQLVGGDTENVIGRTLTELLHTASKADRSALAGLTSDAPDARQVEICATRTDGSVVPLALSRGGCLGERLLIVARDITTRQRATGKLTMAQQELELIFRHAPIGMVICDLSGRILRTNQAFCSMLGYDADSLYERELASLFHPDEQETREEQRQQLFEGDIVCLREEKQFLSASGDTVFGVIRYSVIRETDYEPVMIVVQVVDRTNRVRADLEIREHRERIAEVSRLGTIAEMAAGISHELNQPLTAISNYSQACLRLIRDEAIEPDELQAIMGKIADQAVRASNVISGLRRFVKKRPLTRKSTNVSRLLSEVMLLAGMDARANSIELSVDVEDGLPPIEADAVQIQQVLLNLIRNAIDAFAEKPVPEPVIVVAAQATDSDDVIITVADNGPGVRADVANRIFDPFFTTKPEGLGIGLSFSRSIVESHGGGLSLTNNEPCGTIFRVTLPTLLEQTR